MPLTISRAAASSLAKTLESEAKSTGKNSFLVVYASLINGTSWCGDCRSAEPVLEKKFRGEEEAATVVYAGDKLEWRKPENPWRKAPFSVTNLPTLIKITPDGKWEKLVEVDVYNQKKLDAFVGF
ncbi:hypothetical protein SLS56_009317 [Neofusicoccum ribis]|uniref:Thioredoxin domain-containing protein n=1 Tax=Neofusicoccum ribis TaxID=45134 RepID=A0ABR3SJ64_9PEZI